MIRSLAVTLPIVFACSITIAMEPATVFVDCSRPVNRPLHLWGHVNVSRRAPPPVELCEQIEKEFGRPAVTRCWLMLDQVWDYRDDSYRFNYEINRDYYIGDPHKKRYGVPGVTTGLHYYDYIDSVSKHSDAVLMNIRRYEQEVLTGMVSFQKWKEVFKTAVLHYRQRCPNLRYIEVLNEPTAKNQSNLGKFEQYYDFYRRAYEAINELNAELSPDEKLLVGGCSGFRPDEAIHLVRDFARDEDSAKRLDFLSFHHYWTENTPAAIAGWEQEIDAVLAASSLPTNIPIFVTEIGYSWKWRDAPEKNLWQAVGMTAFQYQARHATDLRLFPWVQYHSPQQIALVQFDTQMRMMPYGAAVKMLRMHRQQEIAADSNRLDKNGNGLGVLATGDDVGLTIQLWNLQTGSSDRRTADVTIVNLPPRLQTAELRIRRYQIDSKHSNCIAKPNADPGLELVEERSQAGSRELRLSADMEPVSLCLWTIEAVESK